MAKQLTQSEILERAVEMVAARRRDREAQGDAEVAAARAAKAQQVEAADAAKAAVIAEATSAKNQLLDSAARLRLFAPYSNAFRLVRDFDLEWNDRGSGAKLSAAFYRPRVPAGYLPLGDYAQVEYKAPKGAVLALRANGPIPWKYPVDYERVWKDSGSGASKDGAFWRAVPPEGYVAVGMLCREGHSRRPSRYDMACVHRDFATPTTPRYLVWHDKSSGADRSVGIYYVEPLGTYFAHGKHGLPDLEAFWTLADFALDPRVMLEPIPRKPVDPALIEHGGTFSLPGQKPLSLAKIKANAAWAAMELTRQKILAGIRLQINPAAAEPVPGSTDQILPGEVIRDSLRSVHEMREIARSASRELIVLPAPRACRLSAAGRFRARAWSGRL